MQLHRGRREYTPSPLLALDTGSDPHQESASDPVWFGFASGLRLVPHAQHGHRSARDCGFGRHCGSSDTSEPVVSRRHGCGNQRHHRRGERRHSNRGERPRRGPTDRRTRDRIRPRRIGETSRERLGWRVSYAGPGASREEIDEMAVTERIRTRSRQVFNGAVFLVWRDATPGRVTATLFAGPTWNRYQHTETSEIVRLPPGVTPEQFARTLPPPGTQSRMLGGLTAGFNVPVVVGRAIRLAPEPSYTHGDVGDHTIICCRPA